MSAFNLDMNRNNLLSSLEKVLPNTALGLGLVWEIFEFILGSSRAQTLLIGGRQNVSHYVRVEAQLNPNCQV